jgi:hypothetical protein
MLSKLLRMGLHWKLRRVTSADKIAFSKAFVYALFCFLSLYFHLYAHTYTYAGVFIIYVHILLMPCLLYLFFSMPHGKISFIIIEIISDEKEKTN